MDDNKEQPQVIQTSKESSKRERQRGSISVRRALMTSVLAAAAALSGYAIGAQQSSADQAPNTPAATETLNPEIYSKLLEQHPDAKVHKGGNLSIFFRQSRNEIFPHIRTDSIVGNDEQNFNVFTDALSYPRVNGVPFQFNPEGTSLQIENYITVSDDNADQTSAYAPNQNWLVLTFSDNNNNDVLGYISMSNQTSEYINIQDYGDTTSLDLFTGSNELNNFNKTTVVSNR
ncbi:MAG: hypothetical protein A3B38_00940 [Candidatus Levybacteria bacterium RIFCSPLOWO2_01_FULL_36_13]|nr:MAG: hypothetical protein A2684_02180 [Candidatus Levybacteria bacterium RIFCSPHIGHO2_01_FULL_36_15b]OGH35454.1 MAG: hypothetical protein A3B38_00940 [Candidatus Levybacteria bacterium RIFCSPLOWO2_01_FULL_36_13]